MVHNDNNASYVRGSFEAYIYGFSFDECETTKLIFNELFSVVRSTHTHTDTFKCKHKRLYCKLA